MAPYLKLITALLALMGGQEGASFSISPPRFAQNANGCIVKIGGFSSKPEPAKPPSFATKGSTIRAASISRGTSTTALRAVPEWALYVLSHNVGGISGAPVVAKAQRWYRRIHLPPWTPPNFVFGPVWTLLYSLMGVSAFRIVKSGSPMTNLATKLWTFHYALNLSWAPVFFGFQNLRLGLVINFFLVASLGYIMKLFHRIDPLAAYLQIPYLLWVLYATKLNQAVCKLNPTVGGVNEAMVQEELCASGDGYNDAMLQYDIKKLQAAAARYAGL